MEEAQRSEASSSAIDTYVSTMAYTVPYVCRSNRFLGQTTGPGPCTIAEFRVVANTTIALCGQTLNKSRSNRSKQGLQAATDRLYEPENF